MVEDLYRNRFKMKFKSMFVFLVIAILFLNSCADPKNDSSVKPLKKLELETPGKIKDAPLSLVEFYDGPSDLSKFVNGDLIYSQVLTDLKANVMGWRVLYATTSLDGSRSVASALIYSPKDNKKHHVIAWAHGTTGLADGCAPSLAQDGTKQISYFDDYINNGYAIIAPDYEGLGTPGVHPYLVGISEGRSILDSVLVAQKFGPINAISGAVVVGHSQGGQGALFAGQLNNTYAPTAKLSGVVGIAPAGELNMLINNVSKLGITNGFVVMGAAGFKAAYKDLNLDAVLTRSVIDKSPELETGCLILNILTFKDDTGTTLVADPSTIEPWATYLEKNSPGVIKIDVPVFIAQGTDDIIVPEFISQEIHDKYCTLDTPANKKLYPNADHSGVLKSARNDVLSFVRKRFDKKEFFSSCK